MSVSSTGLEYRDLRKGEGDYATRGDIVTVHYTGWLKDGKQFDSSVGGDPFSFKLGAGEVIAGWDEGVNLMMVGGKRKLVVPPSLGYGRQGSLPEIPPNAELIFEIEVVAIKKPAPPDES
jgi:FKBP-type peptidyl-prolyl cis-trans isomerase